MKIGRLVIFVLVFVLCGSVLAQDGPITKQLQRDSADLQKKVDQLEKDLDELRAALESACAELLPGATAELIITAGSPYAG